MNKVIRFEVVPTDKEMNKVLWTAQRECSEIANKTVRMCWELFNMETEWKKKTGEYPTKEEVSKILNKSSLSSVIYDRIREEYPHFTSRIVSAITRDVSSKFSSKKKEYLKGTESIVSYKSNYPIPFQKNMIYIDEMVHSSENNGRHEYFLDLVFYSIKGKRDLEKESTKLRFQMKVESGSQKAFLRECNQLTQYEIINSKKVPYTSEKPLIEPRYKVTASELTYDERRKKWYFNLGYSFEGSNKKELDKNRIVGVQIGFVHPCTCAVSDSKSRFIIDKSEIETNRMRVFNRLKALGNQSAYCGNGRTGHGYNTKMTVTKSLRGKQAKFRDCCNHKYSRAIINYALKEKAGKIVLKNLSGVATDNLFLKNWPYYDLQTKIQNKAAEHGIEVEIVEPAYTSSRCSYCGYINMRNEKAQKDLFVCSECGARMPTDLNAARNLATEDIEVLILEQAKQQDLNFPKKKNK